MNGDTAMAMVETVALAAVALAGLAWLQRIEKRREVAGAIRGAAPGRRTLRRGALVAAAGWLFAAVLLLPHAMLVLVSFVPSGTWNAELLPPVLSFANWAAVFSQTERLRPIVNSLWMAGAATAAALALGFAAAWLTDEDFAVRRAAIATAKTVPGSAHGIATTFSVHAPWAGRFVLIGTAAILPLAYLVRNLPLTGRAAFAGLRQLDPALEEAAASLGASPGRRLRSVTLPLLRPALAAGAAIAFITALGDFVVSIVLYTFETRPISIEILSSLRMLETGIGAAYGVLLALLSAVSFVIFGTGAPERR